MRLPARDDAIPLCVMTVPPRALAEQQNSKAPRRMMDDGTAHCTSDGSGPPHRDEKDTVVAHDQRSRARAPCQNKHREHTQSEMKKNEARRETTHFLISYRSVYTRFAFSKSHAMTYSPHEVTIALTSLPSPVLNLVLRASQQRETQKHDAG